MVTYVFNDITGLANYFRLEVYKTWANMSATQTICDETAYTTAGTLTCNVTDSGDGTFTAKGYVSRSPDILVTFISFIVDTFRQSLGLNGLWFSFIFIALVALAGIANPAVAGVLVVIGIFYMAITGFLGISYTSLIAIIILIILVIIKVRS